MTNKIVIENQKQGTPQSVWDIDDPDSSIEGFTTDISTNVGDTVDFKINTPSDDYRIEIYRLGYYNGDGARLVETIDHEGGPVIVQPDHLVDPETGAVDAGNWQITDSWNVPTDAVSGVYIAKLVREDGGVTGSGENHIPFIIREDGSQSDIVFQTSDTTWQAYNSWGGQNLYDLYATSAVSYNRPITTRTESLDGDPTGGLWTYFFADEYPGLVWLEQNGYDVSYISGIDTARNGDQLLNHDVFVSVGHDEYWSSEQRDSVEAARDAGVNLAFWSANEIYWKTEWRPSIDGSDTPFRTMVTYKETESGQTNPSGIWTGTWGDPNAPDGIDPQNALAGTLFTVNGHFGALQVPHEFSQLRLWRDTDVADLQPGETAILSPDILGPEWNENIDNGYRPGGTVNFSSSTYNVPFHLEDFGNNTYVQGDATHSLTLYRAPSGALVFSSGTQYWTWGLSDQHDPVYGLTGQADANIQQAMVNLFADMGIQPETLQANLVAASASTDFEAPVISASLLEVTNSGTSATLSLSGSASDSGGGQVAGVEASFDGGTTWFLAAGTSDWNYTLNGAAPETIEVRAVDDSINLGASAIVPDVVIDRAMEESLSGNALVRTVGFTDLADDEPWVQVWDSYDAADQWVMQTISYDDGSQQIVFLDPYNNEQWDQVWDTYDAQGFWQNQMIDYDDGSQQIAFLDPTDIQPWTQVWDTYDTEGLWQQQMIFYDDGSQQTALLDPSDIQPWTQVWDTYDAQGLWQKQEISYDDGSNEFSTIDSLDTEPWFSDNYIYDAQSVLVLHYQILDNGDTIYP